MSTPAQKAVKFCRTGERSDPARYQKIDGKTKASAHPAPKDAALATSA